MKLIYCFIKTDLFPGRYPYKYNNFLTAEFGYRTNVDYTMGADGVLKSDDGQESSVRPDPDFRYKRETDSLELERSIEKKKQELKDLEEKKKAKQQSSTTIKTVKKPGDTDRSDVVSGPHPVTELAEWF